MRSFQKRRGWKEILESRPVLVFLGIVMLIFMFGIFRFVGKMQITVENRKIIENKVAELEKEKEKLTSDISKLNSTEGVEESIRQKFGLVKEGEGVIVVVDDKTLKPEPKEESRGFFSWLFFWRN